MRLCWTPVLVAIIAGVTPLLAQYEVPAAATPAAPAPVLAYQGRLLEKTLPVTGVRTFTFSILDGAGAELWNSGAQPVSVNNGHPAGGEPNLFADLGPGDHLPVQRDHRHPAVLAAGELPWGCRMSAKVGIIMGSRSDLETMTGAADILQELEVAHEVRIVSAHRTPDWMADYARTASGRGIKVIIAGAGGAAHLPGMTAAHTLLPVLGVPVPATSLGGLDALLSIAQMPAGVPVATLAIGKAGARNAALLAAQILALEDRPLHDRLARRRREAEQTVLAEVAP